MQIEISVTHAKPDKLYIYADFQDDLRNAGDNCTRVKINKDGYMVDPKNNKAYELGDQDGFKEAA